MLTTSSLFNADTSPSMVEHPQLCHDARPYQDLHIDLLPTTISVSTISICHMGCVGIRILYDGHNDLSVYFPVLSSGVFLG